MTDTKTIAEQLPITFPDNPGFSLDQLSYKCPKCGDKLTGDMLVGTVTRVLDSVVAIEGTADCHKCQESAPFNLRVRSEGVMEIHGPDGWRSLNLNPIKVPVGMRVKSALKKFFSRFGEVSHGRNK